MYCDTKEEWMVTALACFKFNFTVATLYTNLGEDGVIYGINQCEANFICTSQELLPKLIKIFDMVVYKPTQILHIFPPGGRDTDKQNSSFKLACVCLNLSHLIVIH